MEAPDIVDLSLGEPVAPIAVGTMYALDIEVPYSPTQAQLFVFGRTVFVVADTTALEIATVPLRIMESPRTSSRGRSERNGSFRRGRRPALDQMAQIVEEIADIFLGGLRS